MKMKHSIALGILALASVPAIAQDSDIQKAIAAVQSVQLNGQGNADAVKAMKVLNAAGADQILPMLKGMAGTNSISANWLRAAVNGAASRAGEGIPIDDLKSFFADKSNDGKARLMAMQIICKADESFFDKTVASLTDDPAMPLREIGVQSLIDQANAIEDDDEKKRPFLDAAFENARDVEQVTAIGKALNAMGQEIDLAKHLGMLTKWKLLSGFDNKDMGGFDVEYGPEGSPLEIKESYDGAMDGTAKWVEGTATDDSLGKVDLNKIIGNKKGIIAYASRTYSSPMAGQAEVRIATQNAHKIWLNGEEVMSNEIYHNSNSVDKFTAPIKLKEGKNELLIKLCQNEQRQPWAQEWGFQVRICDATGKAIQEAE